jgi:hypothetical protein
MDEQRSAEMAEQLSDMDLNPVDESPEEEGHCELAAGEETGPVYLDAHLVESTSAHYLGHWNRLVSTTNWEKGRIISEWRLQLMGAGAPSHIYSDEAWSRRVGNVSSQHVGRLRRVYEQFGQCYQQYDGLYWSHFLAALDWEDDAEMWLEGAVQNSWSVSQMRKARWETLGAIPGQEPQDSEIAAEEPDADVDVVEEPTPVASAGSLDVVTDPGEEEEATDASATDEVQDEAPFDSDASNDVQEPSDSTASMAPVRPFENLPRLPDDLQEAFESFKLAILAHKLTNWQEISRDDVLATLEALKQLALAPSEE